MNIWNKDVYNNMDILYLFNHYITEYDMRSAGFSLIKEFNLLPDKEIKYLSKLKKHNRDIKIGCMQRDNKEFSSNLVECFKLARKQFITANHLDEDSIISIKKDAIFCIEECKYTKFGENIEFRPKHVYTSFCTLKPPGSTKVLQIFHNKYELSVKGISDDNIPLHENYMCDFINKYFTLMLESNRDDVLKFLKVFSDKYKNLELDDGYYREFNDRSKFRLKDDRISDICLDKEDLDISYNFINIITKFILITI